MTKRVYFILTILTFLFQLSVIKAYSAITPENIQKKDTIDNQLKFIDNYNLSIDNISNKPQFEILTIGKTISIQSNKQTAATIKILTFRGKVIFSVHQYNINGSIDVSSLDAGKYIVLIEGHDFIESCKIQLE